MRLASPNFSPGGQPDCKKGSLRRRVLSRKPTRPQVGSEAKVISWIHLLEFSSHRVRSWARGRTKGQTSQVVSQSHEEGSYDGQAWHLESWAMMEWWRCFLDVKCVLWFIGFYQNWAMVGLEVSCFQGGTEVVSCLFHGGLGHLAQTPRCLAPFPPSKSHPPSSCHPPKGHCTKSAPCRPPPASLGPTKDLAVLGTGAQSLMVKCIVYSWWLGHYLFLQSFWCGWLGDWFSSAALAGLGGQSLGNIGVSHSKDALAKFHGAGYNFVLYTWCYPSSSTIRSNIILSQHKLRPPTGNYWPF